MSCSTPNCNCKKSPCGCEQGIPSAPFCGAPTCPNPEPCAETWSDCCVIHNGDSFTYIYNQKPVPANAKTPVVNEVPIPISDFKTGFTILQGERMCDTWQRFIAYYECGYTSVPTPYGLKSNTITSTTINIGWTPVASATSYDVYIAPVSTGSFTLVGTVSANTTPNITATGLTPNTSYYMYVLAYDDNQGAYSCASVSLILTTLSV
jgi:Fibronectin type III domain